jgi:general secretion pathway protein D
MKIFKAVLFYVVLSLTTTTLLYANCNSQLFTFKVRSSSKSKATILNVLEKLTNACNMSMIFTDDKAKEKMNKKITYLNIKNYSLPSLLDLLLTDNNLFYELSPNNILKISYLKTKTFYIDYVSFSSISSKENKTIKTGSKDNGGGTSSLKSTSEFKFWNKIKTEIENILNRDGDSYNAKKTIINQDAGIITVTGTKKQIDRVSKYIKEIMNRLHKQILIDAKILEVTYNSSHSTGINWSKFAGEVYGHAQNGKIHNVSDGVNQLSYLLGYNFDISGLLNFLKTQGDVNIVSNPKILTLNNQPAIINVGEEKNYKYKLGGSTNITNGVASTTDQYEVGSTFVGVTLSIVPAVTEDDFIMLKINPTISEISDRHLDEKGEPSLAPDIKIKQLSSIVKVKNGKKVIIGGLIQKNKEDRETKVPLLGDLPLFGNMFKGKTKVTKTTELILVVTPKLISGDLPNSLDEIEREQ